MYLTKALVPKLQARNNKSAIVFTSSFLGTVVVPGSLTYNMSKRFISVLADGLYKELKDNTQIDVLSFEAFTKGYDYLRDISGKSDVELVNSNDGGNKILEEIRIFGEDLLK